MLPTPVIIQEFVDARGRSPFKQWFDSLVLGEAARIKIALDRLGRGAVSNVKGVGQGVLEYRIDAGPGYRIYFGREGKLILILLAGGTKRRQGDDVAVAKARWVEYKRRKAP